jgi:hypothetical protein
VWLVTLASSDTLSQMSGWNTKRAPLIFSNRRRCTSTQYNKPQPFLSSGCSV